MNSYSFVYHGTSMFINQIATEETLKATDEDIIITIELLKTVLPFPIEEETQLVVRQ